MKLKRFVVCLAALAGLGVSLSAAAQFARPEQAVKYRKAAMTMMGNHMGRLGAVVQGRAPFDAAAAANDAEIVAMVSKLPYSAFLAGTASTEKGGASTVIWTERAKFDDAAKKMQDEVTKLATAARSGNLDQIKAAFGPAAGACKNCHDNFQNQ